MVFASSRLALFVIIFSFLLPDGARATEKQDAFAQKVRSWERTIDQVSTRINSGRAGTIEERDAVPASGPCQ